MAYSQVVLLLVVCLAYIQAQQTPHYNQGYHDDDHILTCIGTNEAYDQIRITLREEEDQYGHSSAFRYGAIDPALVRKNWRVHAMFVPAQALGLVSRAGTASLRGTFFLAVTKNGRTEGRCAGLGGVLMADDLILTQGGSSGFPGRGGFPNFGFPHASPFSRLGSFGGQFGRQGAFGLSHLGGFNRYGTNLGSGGIPSLFGSNFGQSNFGQSSFGASPFGRSLSGRGGAGRAPGMINEPLLAGTGGNVYTSVIRGLAEADLRGRAMALCLDHYCFKPTTTCCTIAKDDTSATENVGAFNGGPIDGNTLINNIQNGNQGLNGFNNLGNLNGIGGIGNIGNTNNGLILNNGDGIGDIADGGGLF